MKAIIVITLLGTFIPTNIFVYATVDTSYVEKVSSNIDVEDTDMKIVNTISSDINDSVVTDIAKVLGMDINEKETYALIFGEELQQYEVIYKSTQSDEVLDNQFKDLHEITSLELKDSNVVDMYTKEQQEKDIRKVQEEKDKERQEEEIKRQAQILKNIQMDALLEINNPDINYRGSIVSLTAEDRYLLEHLVMGEAGTEGIEGAALVAQAIRDTMVYKGFNSVEEVRRALKYSGKITLEPNNNVKRAVSYIFDEGGIAVKHIIHYFYAPKIVDSSFHERQTFVIEYKNHRFFGSK